MANAIRGKARTLNFSSTANSLDARRMRSGRLGRPQPPLGPLPAGALAVTQIR